MTNLQGHADGTLNNAFPKLGDALATSADFGARQTLFATSQTLPGDCFIGPKFGMRGPPA